MKVALFLLCVLVHAATAARQYVEIERRPNNTHDFAGTLAFVFGLTATFFSVLIALLLVGVMIRHSNSSYSPVSAVGAVQRKQPQSTTPSFSLGPLFFKV